MDENACTHFYCVGLLESVLDLYTHTGAARRALGGEGACTVRATAAAAVEPGAVRGAWRGMALGRGWENNSEKKKYIYIERERDIYI